MGSNKRFILLTLMCSTLLGACNSFYQVIENVETALNAQISPETHPPKAVSYQDLVLLPAPYGKIVAHVYNFIDMTGATSPELQVVLNDQSPASALSTGLYVSGWFDVAESKDLPGLIKQGPMSLDASKRAVVDEDEDPPPVAALVLEGGIVNFERVIQTGGSGADYFGVADDVPYTMDSVTLFLRATDLFSGKSRHEVTVTKTVLSFKTETGEYQFVDIRPSEDVDTGLTIVNPVRITVLSAIEAAIVKLVAEGINRGDWRVNDAERLRHSQLDYYLRQSI